MDLQSVGRVLTALGVTIALLGIGIWLGGKLGLGSLPGDIRIEREGWGCYVPVASMILLSLILTILLNLVFRFWRR